MVREILGFADDLANRHPSTFRYGADRSSDKRFTNLSLDPQTGLNDLKSQREAQTILEADDAGILSSPRRPDPTRGESPHHNDFFATVDGVDNVPVEVKGLVDPGVNPLDRQISRISGHIRAFDPSIVVIVDLRNLEINDARRVQQALTSVARESNQPIHFLLGDH